MGVAAIVPAAGIGKRLASRQHKSFIPLAGHPMLYWTLRALERSPSVGEVILVVHGQDLEAARRMVRSCRFRKVIQVVGGGASRMASVGRGLKALPASCRWVVVHDGARPLATPDLIEKTVKAAYRYKAAIAAIPVVPTIKEGARGWVSRTLDRRHLWAVQTPQAFRRDLLEEAHRKGKTNGIKATDDAALVEALGHPVRIVEGSSQNLKVTTPEDLAVAEAFLRRRYWACHAGWDSAWHR